MIVVHPPIVAKNKGSGKRFKSSKELAVEKVVQSTRECKTCHKFEGHDIRNCPLNPNPKSKANAKSKAKSKAQA